VLTLIASVLAVRRAQVSRSDREVAALKETLAAGGGDAATHYRLGTDLAVHGDPAGALAHLEMAVDGDPSDLRFGNDLRLWSVRSREYDRCIRFFERAVGARPTLPEPRLQLALAYVDKMPDHMMGIVGQGRLSKQSIAELTRVLADGEPLSNELTEWSALYAIGLNHLYWPKALRHAPASIEAFRRLIEFQKKMKVAGVPTYFVLAYLGLGDALVKDGRHDEAREVYLESRAIAPDDERLRKRLAAADDAALTDLVDQARGLGIAIDTDLSILWGRKP